MKGKKERDRINLYLIIMSWIFSFEVLNPKFPFCALHCLVLQRGFPEVASKKNLSRTVLVTWRLRRFLVSMGWNPLASHGMQAISRFEVTRSFNWEWQKPGQLNQAGHWCISDHKHHAQYKGGGLLGKGASLPFSLKGLYPRASCLFCS